VADGGPLVSVVIPTYERRERLHRVLAALASQQLDDPFEVVVVSDGSTDGTVEYLRGDDVPLPVVVAEQRNAGPAAARNHGVDLASGDLVVFIDDDVVPAPALLARHVAAHRSLGDDVVVIGPMLEDDAATLSPWTRWEQRMLRKQYAAMSAGEWAPTARQFYTGNASLRRAHLLAAGGFDTRFRRMEDVELAYRLDGLGLRFVFEPEAVGVHYPERSFEAWVRIAHDYGENDVVFAREHGRPEKVANIGHEFRRRHALVRAAVRGAVPRRRAMAWAARGVERLVTGRRTGRLDRLGQAALSCLYNVAYYRGVADGLGGTRELRALLTDGR
jgi:glycosyltransferase involved in cell wall biosynthesis